MLPAAEGFAETVEETAAGSAIRFREVSQPWGLHFRHHHGGTGKFLLMETFGSGIVVFDYDGDGDNDVLFIDSGPLPGYAGEPTGAVLYRNDGPGRFTDVTARAGLAGDRYGFGGVAGDVDGDGHLDLVVTAFGSSVLFKSNGDGTFRDATGSGPLSEPTWSSSAALADVDRDGDLDLYVSSYVAVPLDRHPICGPPDSDLRSYCNPALFEGLPDRFLRNRGDGTFEDRTAEAGFSAARGKGLGVIFADVDEDGWLDLYVANDTTPNFLFRNLGDGTFEDLSLLSGTALNVEGKAEAGMGVDFGDVDGDGREELFVTNFDLETNGLYGNLGSALFNDRRFVAGVAEPSLYRVGFGTAFGDFDFDGDLDLAVANGHILDNIELFPRKKGNAYRQPNQILENRGGGVFREVAEPGLTVVRSSRGLAMGDLDGDGDLDLLISNSNEEAEVYENLGEAAGPALGLRLVGAAGAPAYGTRVRVVDEAGEQLRELRSGSSYLSQNEAVLRFGVAGERVRVTIRWPDGSRRVVRGLPAGKTARLRDR